MSTIRKKLLPPKYNVPGFPIAPVNRRRVQPADLDYLARKAKLVEKLPFYSPEEVTRRQHSYHVVILHELILNGYNDTVREIASILKKEEVEIKAGKIYDFIVADKPKFKTMVEALRVCHDYYSKGNFETVAHIRKDEGERLMKSKDIWLAKHFLFTALYTLKKMICFDLESIERRNRTEAEIHCLLAFIARDDCEDLEQALEAAVNHLVVCRELSKRETWQFKPHIISIRLLKPIAIHGLRNEYEIIDGCSMTLYMIATLLEHEMLIGLANQILHVHKYPSPEDLQQAHILADHALRLAFEVRQPIALSSALMRFGVVLRHTGEYEDAIKYFEQLAHHCEVTQDEETLAIAYHNIGMCQLGLHKSTAALESLTKQKVISDMFELVDLQADALQELGLVLLLEGHVWESEQCYSLAYEMLIELEDEGDNNARYNYTNTNFVMCGISAGEQLWPRFAGLVRNAAYYDLMSILSWKNKRIVVQPVQNPNYVPQKIKDALTNFVQSQAPATVVPTSVHNPEDDEENEEGKPLERQTEASLDLNLLRVSNSLGRQFKLEITDTDFEIFNSDINYIASQQPKKTFSIESTEFEETSTNSLIGGTNVSTTSSKSSRLKDKTSSKSSKLSFSTKASQGFLPNGLMGS